VICQTFWGKLVGILRRYTCVHFPNSYGSLNISSGGLTRRVIWQTFWGKLVGLQWDLVQR